MQVERRADLSQHLSCPENFGPSQGTNNLLLFLGDLQSYLD
jgi:hypothetical protein